MNTPQTPAGKKMAENFRKIVERHQKPSGS